MRDESITSGDIDSVKSDISSKKRVERIKTFLNEKNDFDKKKIAFVVGGIFLVVGFLALGFFLFGFFEGDSLTPKITNVTALSDQGYYSIKGENFYSLLEMEGEVYSYLILSSVEKIMGDEYFIYLDFEFVSSEEIIVRLHLEEVTPFGNGTVYFIILNEEIESGMPHYSNGFPMGIEEINNFPIPIPTVVCGDGICSPGESSASCGIDCTTAPPPGGGGGGGGGSGGGGGGGGGPTASTCGDGTLDPGEECDDGNLDNGDGCSDACVVEFCGDGTINNNDEVCELGNDGLPGTSDDVLNGEDCVSLNQGDGGILFCSFGCANFDITQCTVSAGAECSEGTDNDVDGFIDFPDDLGCLSADDPSEQSQISSGTFINWDPNDGYVIGSGLNLNLLVSGDTQAVYDVVFQTISNTQIQGSYIDGDSSDGWIYPSTSLDQVSEGSAEIQAIVRELDSSGNAIIINTLSFPTTFNLGPECGDGTINQDSEQCDDGANNNDLGQCNLLCQLTSCGDGTTQNLNGNGENEQCDDGANGNNNDLCFDDCSLTFCGDGEIQQPNGQGTGGPNNDGIEQCDDGNNINDDGCTNSCESVFPLTEFIDSSYYNEGFATALSKDGNYLYRSDGSMLQKIDLNLLRATNPPDIGYMITSEIKIYSGTMDMEEINNFVYVCGADFGIHKTNKELTQIPELIDIHSRDIWCTSLTYTNLDNKDLLLALWSGLGDTELRIYDTQDDSLLASVPINVQTGLANEGIGWDIEVDSIYAYVAIDTSGIARVDIQQAINQGSSNPVQGPLAVTNPNYDRETQKLLSVKDISIRDGFLYAAASAQGLIGIDLSQPWSDSMQTTTYFHENYEINQYPSKISTLTDATTSSTIVIVQTYNTPNPSEWGPYVMYGGFKWDSGSPLADVNELDDQNHDYTTSNTGNRVTIFEKRQGASNLVEVLTEQIYNPGPREKLLTLSTQQVGDEYFAYGNLPAVYNFFRDTDNRIKLRDLTIGREFIQGRGAYMDGRESLIEPGKIVAGSDAGFHSFHKLEGSPLRFLPIDGTYDADHNLGHWNEITWITPENKEFIIMGGSGESWPLREVSWLNGFPSVDSWKIPVNIEGEGSTDTYGYDSRGYAHAGLDLPTGLVALSRSTAKEGLIFTTKDSIYDSAKSSPLDTDIIPQILLIFNLHEEAPPASGIGEEILYAFHPKFFRDKNQRRFLAVPAGYYVDVNSPNYQRPKIVFLEIPEPFDESTIKNTVVIGPESPSMVINIQIIEFDQKQMAIAVGGNGDVYLHNLEKLSEVIDGQSSPSELGAITTWKMRDQPFDKRKTLISDLRVRQETVNNQIVTRVYVAANNDGVYILELRKEGNNYYFEEIQRLNTIYQAVGLSIENIDGKDVLLVYDHGGGIIAFVDINTNNNMMGGGYSPPITEEGGFAGLIKKIIDFFSGKRIIGNVVGGGNSYFGLWILVVGGLIVILLILAIIFRRVIFNKSPK